MSMFAALAMLETETPHGHREYTEPKESEKERKRRLDKAEIERYKTQGLKEFFYGKNSLWALNQKSADRKARRQHWL